MKIAIHHRGGFSERWISYCVENNIPHKIVDCLSDNIVKQIEDCAALLWHHQHGNDVDTLLAKQLLFSLEQTGKSVFPDFKTNWHFDDKLAQKYLFEAHNVPSIKTYVFYRKKEALEWLGNSTLPKVFKLRSGAGSLNVKLIETYSQGEKIIRKAFNGGFKKIDNKKMIVDKFKKFLSGHVSSLTLVKYLVEKLFFSPCLNKTREIGYVYFQDFIPNNKSDIRVVVVGNKAFAIERFTRKNDFRASGSGNIKYLTESDIDKSILKIAFETTKKLQAQCIAFDFVYKDSTPLIIEISYAFTAKAYDDCPGYWDDELTWFEGRFNPQHWMIKNLINRISNN